MDGRVALVTGANHGIGAAIARELAAGGVAVLVTALRTASEGQPAAYVEARQRSVEDVAAAIRDGGGRAVAIEADLSDPAVPARLFDRAEAELGPVDVLVNNASGWRQDTFGRSTADAHGRSMEAVTAATVDANLAVDARAAALLIAEFAARHRARGGTWGRIVGLVSGGVEGFPTEVSYGAAKAAQISYTLAAAIELADQGITANLVHPPVTDTGWVTEEVREFVARSMQHTHVATSDEVAEVVRWLCSDAADLVSGNILRLR